MLKIFHNPRCKHSRAGLEYLKSKTGEFEVREYLKNTLTTDEIKEILLKTNLEPSAIVRPQEDYFKKFLKGKSFTVDEWVKIIRENPKLLQRPIVVGKLKAVIGNPPHEIDKVLR
ncbi:MAG: ArsC/Spx/MgsR family protein [Tenuifilaceae bacterium]|jgi:arsenate reductase|uniref:ArsC/Spx/MgsR family protein n=1 Tax=Perlabentimonas gracilis TaxID=2715279 RepID=UPI0014098E5B|nr:ArsC/Spx/MgsR family protein [Perlabentimonas gracilis]MDX9770216.1 ArsC/Spx/MgsR family protein [Tenuifilaceae bacterium]NHB69379.1 arsenate reductase [Perlabentimonas gracilis]